jgi:uncharacterized protein
VDVPAFDSCRAWRQWEAENAQIGKIEDLERELGLQRKLMQALSKSRLFGGAAMVMGIEGHKFEDELDVDDVGEGDLAFVHVVSRWEIEAGPLIRDLTSPWYGEPSYYRRVNSVVVAGEQVNPPIEQSGVGYEPGAVLLIHPSRVVRLVPAEYPDLMMAQDSWGDSALQPVIDAVKAAGLVSSSIAAMVAEAKLDIVKVPGLLEMLATKAGADRLYERFSFSLSAKSVVNTTLIDSKEEWERINLSFAGMDAVMGMYLKIAAGAADIPATRLLGDAPTGMNATGDSDTRNYYDRLQADQQVRVQPALTRLDEVLIRSALGSRDEDIHYIWKPLWQLSDDEQSQIWLRKAQAHKVDVDCGLINPDVLREVRVNQCIEDSFYPGLEAAVEEHDIEPDEDEHDLLALQQGQMGMKQQQEQHQIGMKVQQQKLKQMRDPRMNGLKPPSSLKGIKPSPSNKKPIG